MWVWGLVRGLCTRGGGCTTVLDPSVSTWNWFQAALQSGASSKTIHMVTGRPPFISGSRKGGVWSRGGVLPCNFLMSNPLLCLPMGLRTGHCAAACTFFRAMDHHIFSQFGPLKIEEFIVAFLFLEGPCCVLSLTSMAGCCTLRAVKVQVMPGLLVFPNPPKLKQVLTCFPKTQIGPPRSLFFLGGGTILPASLVACLSASGSSLDSMESTMALPHMFVTGRMRRTRKPSVLRRLLTWNLAVCLAQSLSQKRHHHTLCVSL